MEQIRKVKIVKIGNWESLFFKKIKTLFDNSELCDLTLQFLDNFQLRVHRFVLNACTDYFSILETTCGMIEDTLLMPGDVSSEVIIAIVNFIYTGSIRIETPRYDELLKSSKDMKLTALTKLLEAHRPEPSQELKPVAVKSEPTHVEAINLEPLDIPIKKEPVDPLEDCEEEESSESRESSDEDYGGPLKKKPRKTSGALKTRRNRNPPCTECNKKFATKHELRVHIKQVHTNSCTVCHRIFYKQDEFDAHDLQVCILMQQLICSKCSMVFRSKEALDEHFKGHLEENQGYTKKCHIKGINRSKLEQIGSGIILTCPHCESFYKTRKTLLKHIRMKHTPDAGKNFFQCEICEKTFAEKHHLRYHENKKVCVKK